MAGPLKFLPIGRTAAAWWAWRNRRELVRWVGFFLRTLPPGGRRPGDVVTEARLRAALSSDERTRGVPSLSVLVDDGVARLDGYLAPELHDLVATRADDTKGVRRVDCSIRDRGRRRSPMNHAHVVDVSALPPVPPRPA